MRIIADSGSTKTAWALIDGATIEFAEGQGINPFHLSEEAMQDIIKTDLLPLVGDRKVEDVWFFGAGCTEEKCPVVASCLSEVLNHPDTVTVGSDMLGAAKALCGDKPGMVCILGTGANSCYYDGVRMTDNVPALGYILGDEGSGAYIGKRLVGDMFKRQFADELFDCFVEETGLTVAEVVEKVYRQPLPNRFLASLTLFCSAHRQHPQIHAFLVDCFSEFVRRNVVKNKQSRRGDCVHFIGSIAYYFRTELEEALNRHGYQLGVVLRAPIEGLVKHYAQTALS